MRPTTSAATSTPSCGVGGTLVYYTAAILVFFLICNLLGHRYGDASGQGAFTRTAPQLSSRSSLYRYWDASMPCSPETTITFIIVCIFPSCIIARIVRGAYMYHYRWWRRTTRTAARRGVLLICQPSVITKKLMQYFSRRRASRHGDRLPHPHLLCRARVGHPRDHRHAHAPTPSSSPSSSASCTSTSKLTLRQTYESPAGLLPTLTTCRPPYGYNWTLRFRLIRPSHLLSVLARHWWALRHIDAMLVDGHTITQLYNMRSEKEERLAGGFRPRRRACLASALQGGDGRPTRRRRPRRSAAAAAAASAASAAAAARGRELEQKLAEADLDRTLCKNGSHSSRRARGVARGEERGAHRGEAQQRVPVQRLRRPLGAVESGFKQLERYYETAGRGGGDGEGEVRR